jgi:aspartate dehydrogenase
VDLLHGVNLVVASVGRSLDPDASGNRHLLEARGAFGEISASVLARTLPDNPKTSMLTPYSLVRTIANLAEPSVL